ncbi:hypothetical protein OLZ33_04485 [Pantoea ananatis]|uniref:hypothetical protein n=1 Tax=Pantoea ananas TaxID=553 RepID=UPI0022230170|nr:hypothetical protein [Pantoea ananatis]MCW1831263.1 hypothetical protein [Pantoea ananatis]
MPRKITRHYLLTGNDILQGCPKCCHPHAKRESIGTEPGHFNHIHKITPAPNGQWKAALPTVLTDDIFYATCERLFLSSRMTEDVSKRKEKKRKEKNDN